MSIQIAVYDDDFFKDDKNAYIDEIRAISTTGEWIDISYHCDEVPSISDGMHCVYFGVWGDGSPIIWVVEFETDTMEQIDLGSFDKLTDAILFCDNRRDQNA